MRRDFEIVGILSKGNLYKKAFETKGFCTLQIFLQIDFKIAIAGFLSKGILYTEDILSEGILRL